MADTVVPESMSLQPTDYGALRYGETETHFIDLIPMFYTVRVVLTKKTDTTGYEKAWCYPSLLAAYAAVLVWDPATEPTPAGWVKEAHTGRRPNGEVY